MIIVNDGAGMGEVAVAYYGHLPGQTEEIQYKEPIVVVAGITTAPSLG
jgi:hypothetical protein